MPSPLRHASALLVQYAVYHRNRRNIATQFVGIPMIVFAISVLLAKPTCPLGSTSVPVIAVVWLLSTLWYLTRGLLASPGSSTTRGCCFTQQLLQHAARQQVAVARRQ